MIYTFDDIPDDIRSTRNFCDEELNEYFGCVEDEEDTIIRTDFKLILNKKTADSHY